jgi:tetratricopeptide (TPR) repeat protein/mono/diheme cytochrome c family protein
MALMYGRRHIPLAAWFRVALAAGLMCLAAPRALTQGSATVSFQRDIAPLVADHCTSCHRDGGDAPFSLTTAGAIGSRATTIAAVVRSRYMPPWKPEPGFGEFHGTRRLPDEAVAQITEWVKASAPLDMPDHTTIPAPRIGEAAPPDLTLQLPAFQLRADGPDVFRNFVVPVSTESARYVRGIVFHPRGRAVHHANIRVDATGASRQLDDADADAGYEGLILKSADFPDGHFLGWTPGQIAPVLSDDLAWPLPARSDLVVQLHLRPTGRVEDVAPAIDLYFTDRPPARRPVVLRLGRQTLDIPGGADAFRVEDAFVLPVAVDVHAVQPHAHFRAREVDAWALLPDGTRQPLLRISDWDARWQDRYRYRTPVRLPAGTRLVTSYVFDNSAANPRNPVQPPALAEWGWRTRDEMGDVWFQMLSVSENDRSRLSRESRQKMLAEDALGSEVLVRREPDHLALRNDAGVIYMALGRPADALRHFEAVTRLQPAAASAWFNVGVALEALGRLEDAASRYSEALKRQPGYSAALNNLGALSLRAGRIEDAREKLEAAVAADPRNVEARANLGLLLAGAGEPDRAVAEVSEALRQRPDLAGALTPTAWLLATHPAAAVRRPDAARALAGRIVEATGRKDAAALDALAAAHAASGDFDAAVHVAGEALALATGELAASIRERQALYKARRPYVLPK